MAEDEKQFKTIMIVLWIAIITAVLVTIIDWKIKQDILRMTDAFYKVYGVENEQRTSPVAASDDNGPVLRDAHPDSDTGLEAETVENEAGTLPFEISFEPRNGLRRPLAREAEDHG